MVYGEDYVHYTLRLHKNVLKALKDMAVNKAYTKRKERITVASLIRDSLRKEYPHMFEGID
jgi:hypothetical protein